MRYVKNLLLGTLMALFAAAAAAGELDVLPDTIGGAPKQNMLRQYLLGQADQAWNTWEQAFEETDTDEEIAAYQKAMRECFLARLGAFPERTPLNARVTGTMERPGYRVEGVLFESQPGFHVTAALFLPASDKYAPPYPGVIVPCGHAKEAKAYEPYQSMGALLALNGMAALVFDPVDQGERFQIVDAQGNDVMWGTQAHNMLGTGSILVGRNTAWFEIWDGMRAIDYVQSRPEVDGARIGCTGNSGGGTQTAYIMALDERVDAAAPSCYINRAGRQLETATGDAEQNIFGQLRVGMDHADYLMMRAPTPILLCAATKDFFDIRATWDTYRYAKRRYTRMGYAERLGILENPAGHNYNKTQREGVVRWLARWLCGRDAHIEEPALDLFSEEELDVTPEGLVVRLPGARTAYQINAEYEVELAGRRNALWRDRSAWPKLLREVGKVAGIRPLAQLPEPEVAVNGTVEARDYAIEKLVLRPEKGIHLPGLALLPQEATEPGVCLYLDERGKSAACQRDGAAARLAASGARVLAIDVRGTGETEQTGQNKFGESIGTDWEDVVAAYVLGESYVGMRAEDVLVCARYARERFGGPVRLVADGHVGVPALHAAALEPDLFGAVELRHTLGSWAKVVHTWPTRDQWHLTVHGALRLYDLPDLVKTLGDKLTVAEPRGPMG